MRRERLAWLVSAILLAILAFQLPGTLAQPRDDDYSWVRTLVEVHRQVLNNYVEKVSATQDSKMKEKAVEGMLSDLDPFTNYVPPQKQEEFDKMLGAAFKGVGMTLDEQDGKPTVVTPIEGSPADRAGVHAGDIISKVNGESVLGVPLEEVVKKITGPIGTEVHLTVQRDDQKEIELTMNREEIVVPTVKGFDRTKDDSWNYWVCENPKIAYIRITQFDAPNASTSTVEELQKVLQGTTPSPGSSGQSGLLDEGLKGLILDLRFNPGGLLDQAVDVVKLFVKDGVIVTTRGNNRPEEIKRADGQGTLPYFPLIVLVNDRSASAAEIVSGSLKDNHRALIIGQRTYGKGSVQELIPLEEDDGELKLTVAYYFLPSGRLVHRKKDATDWGVEPNIIVPVDDAGELSIREQFQKQETIRRSSSTRPMTQPTTEPTDPQLQQAVNTMVGLIVLDGSKAQASRDAATMPAPLVTTAPATQP